MKAKDGFVRAIVRALVILLLCAMLVMALVMAAAVQAHDSGGYNEQETIFYLEQKVTSLMAPILDRIGVPDLPWWKPHATGRSADLPHRWDWNHAGDEKHRNYITISAIFYDDGDSKVLHTETSDPKTIKGQGWSRLFITGDQAFDDTVTVSMDLETTKSSSYSADVSFSITNRTTVEVNEGEVKASDEVETTASSSFGLNNSKAETTTEHWSESTGVHIDAHQNLRLVADKQSYTEIRTIEEVAYVDFKFQIHLHRGTCSPEHHHSDNGEHIRYLCDGESFQPLHFDNLQDFIDFVKGRHPREHPNMVGFYQDIKREKAKGNDIARQAVANIAWIENKDNRKVSITRKDSRDYQNAGELRTEAA